MKILTKTHGAVVTIPVALFIALSGAAGASASCTDANSSTITECVPGDNTNDSTSVTPTPTAPSAVPTVKPTSGSTPSSIPTPTPSTAPSSSPTSIPNQISTAPIPIPEVRVTDVATSNPITTQPASGNGVGNQANSPRLDSVTEVPATSSIPSPSSSSASSDSVEGINATSTDQKEEQRSPSWLGPVYLALLAAFTIAIAIWFIVTWHKVNKEKISNKK